MVRGQFSWIAFNILRISNNIKHFKLEVKEVRCYCSSAQNDHILHMHVYFQSQSYCCNEIICCFGWSAHCRGGRQVKNCSPYFMETPYFQRQVMWLAVKRIFSWSVSVVSNLLRCRFIQKKCLKPSLDDNKWVFTEIKQVSSSCPSLLYTSGLSVEFNILYRFLFVFEW